MPHVRKEDKVKTTKVPPAPKPQNMVLVFNLVYNWTCPRCHKENRSRTPHTTEYLTARCGHCHFWTALDYHRETDAPPAALRLEAITLRDRFTPNAANRSQR
jgi:transcription elongation factor Elf1